VKHQSISVVRALIDKKLSELHSRYLLLDLRPVAGIRINSSDRYRRTDRSVPP
jgi:hypothetical protein